MATCYSCGKKVNLSAMVSRHDRCESCYADMRVCKMCTFYDVKAYNECREPSAERIVDKTKANFCDYFNLSSGTAQPSKEDLWSQADALFKKK